MEVFFRFLADYEILIYLLLALGGLFSFRRVWRSWGEWRNAYFGLEREFALRRLGQAVGASTLILALACGVFIVASFIVPGLPASALLGTPTVDLLAGPLGTLAPDSATALGSSQAAAPAAGQGGCVPGQLEIASPKSGDEVSGNVEIIGTVNLPNFGFYKYEIAPAGTENWATVLADHKTGVGIKLGDWSTTVLTPGDYLLRLVVTDNQGQLLPPCIISVRVKGQ
jgi:hypothetical protein